MSYFRTTAEALHLAVSDDGLTWRALHQSQPVLEGSVGSKTLRDPFIVPTPDGFHFFSTDSWNSTGIVHAFSDDLIQWSTQELWRVMEQVPETRNCWAPECFRDEEADCWRVIWSSTVGQSEDGTKYDHRIWQVTTDFKTYSEPSLFFDPGYNVIDASVLRHEHGYLMAFKDERGENRFGTENKAMRVAFADRATGPWHTVSDLITPALTEGPTLYRTSDDIVMLYDCFMEHRFGAAKSQDGLVWIDISESVIFPPLPRHASVFMISEEIGKALLQRWG